MISCHNEITIRSVGSLRLDQVLDLENQRREIQWVGTQKYILYINIHSVFIPDPYKRNSNTENSIQYKTQQNKDT